MPWLRRFPIVATIHDASPHSGDWLHGVIVKSGNLLVTRSVDQVIVHGREQADVLKQAYQINPGKVNVIPHISQDMYKPDVSEHQASDTHNVLFFGRLRAYKGLEVLIRAAPLIAAAVPDMRIVICGSGEYPIVHQAAAMNPSWFEVHNRFIEADEVPFFFQQAAIVVLPYLDATQTGIIPIAYQFSRPVVASRVGSIPEVVDNGKTGYLVTPGDERSLADAIIRLLLDNSLREEMGKAAKAKLEQDLSWDVIASKTIQVYKRALESKNAR
jgi:glycosyltransferase involved in cell wall biosynthesis